MNLLAKLILLIFLLQQGIGSVAQENICGTTPYNKEKMKEMEQMVKNKTITSTSPLTYLPVKLHLVKSTGSATTFFPMKNFMSQFARLNEEFLDMGFQFYLADSINYIDDYRLDDLDGAYNYNDSLALVENNVNDAINVYYVNESNVGGRSNFISGDKFYNWMFVLNYVWQQGETLIHEMGHYFNLYHTFEQFYGHELVNGSNCEVAGDLVCDTPADPYPTHYDRSNCVYTGSSTDANGHVYSPSTSNVMSYYSGGCRQNFTNGQKMRAQASHLARLDLIAAAGNQYDFSYPSNDTISITNVRAFELYGSVRVRWNCFSSPIGFLIERSTSPTSGFKTIGGVQNYIREFVDTDFEEGITYYYRVKAANSKDNYSNIAPYETQSMSYSMPETYYAGSHDIRYVRFYNSMGNTATTFYATKSLEPYEDVSSTIRYLNTDEKYRIYWLDYYDFSSDRDSFKVWVDFNKNKMFENQEIIAKGNGAYSSDSVLFAPETPSGYYRVRFRTNNKSYAFGPDGRQLYSDTKDFTLFINGACAEDLPVTSYNYGDFYANGTIHTVDYTQLYPDPYAGYPLHLHAPSVEMNPGFYADGYNTFSAQTGGCP